jgi:hypothetical protein
VALAGRHRRDVEAALFRGEAVHAEDVAHERLRLQPDEDVVAEQQIALHRADVARHAVVLGAHPLGREQGQLRAAERLNAALVERLRTLAELDGLVEQALADDVVAAALDWCAVPSTVCRSCPSLVSGHPPKSGSLVRGSPMPGPSRGRELGDLPAGVVGADHRFASTPLGSRSFAVFAVGVHEDVLAVGREALVAADVVAEHGLERRLVDVVSNVGRG